MALLARTDGLDPVITHTFEPPDAAEAMDVAADPAAWGKVILQSTQD